MDPAPTAGVAWGSAVSFLGVVMLRFGNWSEMPCWSEIPRGSRSSSLLPAHIAITHD